jgi:hypothetical protein
MAHQRRYRPKNGDWVHEMIEQGVLTKISGEIPPMHGGVTLICDSETDPRCLVEFGLEDFPVRLIATEAGVLLIDAHVELIDEAGAITKAVVLEPLVRAGNEGIVNVLLCVNPHSIAGPMLQINAVDLVDRMMRAGSLLRRWMNWLNVGHIVHVSNSHGGHANYFVALGAWHTFYAIYERDVKNRRNDPDESAIAHAARDGIPMLAPAVGDLV